MDWAKLWFFAFAFTFILLIGGTLNIVVTEANSCKMPIMYRGIYSQDACYLPITSLSEANKTILADIIRIRGSKYNHYFSIGDFIAFFGGFGLFITLTSIAVKERKS